MIFWWFKQRRRKRLLAQPFPPTWETYLSDNVKHWHYLDAQQQAKLRQLVQVFVAEKTWEFCGGLEEDDEVKVTIAAQACLLLLGIEHDYYRNVSTIILYPSTYVDNTEEIGEDGFVIAEPSVRLGEAHLFGPVVLAWDSVKKGGLRPEDGRNLVYHEFAHKLDMTDGEADGTPELSSRSQYQRWHEVMSREYERLCAISNQGGSTLIDQYGCTNLAEFFAVAVECFFDRPRPMRRQHPQLYEILSGYFHQDPANWLPQPA